MTHPKTTKPMTKLSFRKVVLAMLAITVVFAFSSCSKDSKNVKIFKDAAMKLDKTEHTLEYEYDDWPEGGIRNVGSHLTSLIPLSQLEKMLPCPLFVSGPHKNGEWNLYDYEEFGHYNPEAIQYLADIAEKVVSDKKFVKMSKPLVEKYLYNQMHIMMVLHDAMYDDNYFNEDGRDYVFNDILEGQGYSDEGYYIFNSLNLLDENNIYLYYGIEMLHFWARRYADGTIDEFYDALSTVFMAYFPDYVFDPEYYWLDEWYEGEYDDYYEETFYSVDLEPDEPVTDAERIKENDAIEMIKTATEKLDKSFNVIENDFDYWPECGLRNTASHLFSLISLRTVNRMLPCNLYLEGPHYNNRWDFNNPWTFGYYNPEAIKYLNKLAKQIVSDKKFVDRTRPLVDEYMKRQLFILKSLYDALNNPDICPNKEDVLQEMLGNGGYYWEESATMSFMDQLNLEDGTYVWGNTGNMFLYWWARRWADDTMELFHEGLETIYNAYYPAE